MIPFTCGTYHGLFVDTGVSSVLPKDLGYFDFRTNSGRALPADGTPNLVLRYNSNSEHGEHPMMMIALTYLAIEGTREGFVSFGSLIFEPFSSKKIEEGIQAAIKVARNSNDFFDGKTISKRPVPKEGRSLDLTKLPLYEGSEFFGELNANINNVKVIEDVSKFAKSLVSSGIDHYEVVISPRRGMSKPELLEHFSYLVSSLKQKSDEVRERMKRLQDRKRQEAALQSQKIIDRKKQNSFLLQITAFGVIGVALLGLTLFVLMKLFFNESETSNNKLSGSTDTVVDTETPLVISKAGDAITKDSEIICEFEELSSDVSGLRMILTDLPTNGKCINISETVTGTFDTKAFEKILTFSSGAFDFHYDLPEGNQMFLTSFGRIIDRRSKNTSADKYSDEEKNFSFPVTSHSFAISMQSISPSLICNYEVSENDDNFEYYTVYQNDYRESMKWFSNGILSYLGRSFQKVSEKIRDSDPGNPEAVRISSSLGSIGRDFENFVKSQELKHYSGDWNSDKKKCVVLVTQEDANSFNKEIGASNENMQKFYLDEFITAKTNISENYGELIKNITKFQCHKIPSLFMVWEQPVKVFAILENATGFPPHTEDGPQFSYTPKHPRGYSEPVYALPAQNKFDDLIKYFDDGGLSAFSSRLYEYEDFCRSVDDQK